MNKTLIEEYVVGWLDNCFQGRDREALLECLDSALTSDQDLTNWGLRPNVKYLSVEEDLELDKVREYAHEFFNRAKLWKIYLGDR